MLERELSRLGVIMSVIVRVQVAGMMAAVARSSQQADTLTIFTSEYADATPPALKPTPVPCADIPRAVLGSVSTMMRVTHARMAELLRAEFVRARACSS